MRTVLAYAVGLGFAVALLLAGWVVGCAGPRPAVRDARLTAPGTPDGPYRVTALIENRGLGEGPVQVTFILKNRSAGWVVTHNEQVTLPRQGTVLVTAEIPAPVADYELEVKAEYPPP